MMISVSAMLTIFISTILPLELSGQIEFIHQNMADHIEWQDESSTTKLSKHQAQSKLAELYNPKSTKITRSHPIKLSYDKTYGILHISDEESQEYRLFYYCQKSRGSQKHKVVKLRVTKI